MTARKSRAHFENSPPAAAVSLERIRVHARSLVPRPYTNHSRAAEGDSKWTFFNGNYQEYEADKKKRLGEEGAKPKRIRFKPLK